MFVARLTLFGTNVSDCLLVLLDRASVTGHDTT